MAVAKNPITPRLFRFLRELERNNDRAWFAANKSRYLADVRDPLLVFIAAFAPELEKIAPDWVADPRPVGGSLLRIHRDTRFAKDKSPYKTHAAMAFRHAAGKELPGPAFYLHLGPGSVFAGAGIWHPMPDTLKQIRDAIVARPEHWRRTTRGKGSAALDEDDQRLSRPPRGYDPEHPWIEDLKRKSFTTGTEFGEKDACAPGFLGAFAKSCRRAKPLVSFLSEAVGGGA
ncbi:MAG: DUF2461 domain-containing protein [Myxococcota bacterium]